MILNGKVIHPGEMNTQVVLRSRVLTEDAGGFVVPGGDREMTVWCKWINAHGREAEVLVANIEGAQNYATLLMRYLPEVDETWAVVYRGKVWEIRSIDNIHEKDEWMEVRVSRTGAG